jgi:hypothetical protein
MLALGSFSHRIFLCEAGSLKSGKELKKLGFPRWHSLLLSWALCWSACPNVKTDHLPVAVMV